MKIRVAINGFGRIGRVFFRSIYNHPYIEVVAINDLADVITMAHLLKYDSVHGQFDANIRTSEDKLIVDEKGLKQVSDESTIFAMIDEVLAANLDKVNEYRGGKDKLFGFFVGQIMKASKGQANPGMVNQLLKQKLDI